MLQAKKCLQKVQSLEMTTVLCQSMCTYSSIKLFYVLLACDVGVICPAPTTLCFNSACITPCPPGSSISLGGGTVTCMVSTTLSVAGGSTGAAVVTAVTGETTILFDFCHLRVRSRQPYNAANFTLFIL